jgi:hypothetical protein
MDEQSSPADRRDDSHHAFWHADALSSGNREET